MANQTDIVDGDIKADKITGNGGALSMGRLAKTISDTDTTLTGAECEAKIIEISGTLTAPRNIVLVTTDGYNPIVYNATGQTLTFKTSGGTGIAVATTKRAMIYCDGTNYVRVTADT